MLRVRLALRALAAVGAGLLVAGSGCGEKAEPEGARGAARSGLDPNVAVRISAADPAETLPIAEPRLEDELRSQGASQAARAARMLSRDLEPYVSPSLLEPLSFAVLSLERSCPPPAVLDCRPGIRFVGRFEGELPAGMGRTLRRVLGRSLRESGFGRLAFEATAGGESGGRVITRGETVARWRVERDLLQIATGGLSLRPAREVLAPAPAGPSAELEADPHTLAALLSQGL
jgi:hypothetical protein